MRVCTYWSDFTIWRYLKVMTKSLQLCSGELLSLSNNRESDNDVKVTSRTRITYWNGRNNKRIAVSSREWVWFPGWHFIIINSRLSLCYYCHCHRGNWFIGDSYRLLWFHFQSHFELSTKLSTSIERRRQKSVHWKPYEILLHSVQSFLNNLLW